jgi:hypothetical protein
MAAMRAVRSTASLALLLGLLPGLALAANTQPLRLELPALATTPTPAAAVRPSAFTRSLAPRPARTAPLFQRNGTRVAATRPEVETKVQSLGRQALENVLDPGVEAIDNERGEGKLQLKFQKRGNAFRDLNKGYREMCDRVSQKLWDDPNGKRVRFDVAGKPGFGIEIPVGHH